MPESPLLPLGHRGVLRSSGGNGNWRMGLKALLPSQTDQRAVMDVVNFIGGKVHGGHTPSRVETEHGLKLTVTTLTFLVVRVAQ